MMLRFGPSQGGPEAMFAVSKAYDGTIVPNPFGVVAPGPASVAITIPGIRASDIILAEFALIAAGIVPISIIVFATDTVAVGISNVTAAPIDVSAVAMFLSGVVVRHGDMFP